MKPIYEPKGRAKEYGDYCVNIYTGCNHGCTYCYCPAVLRMSREDFMNVRQRTGLLDALNKQLATGEYKDKLIHLCFSCDPYPAPPVDTTITREVIKAIKAAGAHVQILTKGGRRAERDFDLLDKEDWFGVTYTGNPEGTLFEPLDCEPNAAPVSERLHSLAEAYERGVNTWVSLEPVINARDVLHFLDMNVYYVKKYKIGKLNHAQLDTNWAEFGRRAERICQNWRHDYYIKADLRREMERSE